MLEFLGITFTFWAIFMIFKKAITLVFFLLCMFSFASVCLTDVAKASTTTECVWENCINSTEFKINVWSITPTDTTKLKDEGDSAKVVDFVLWTIITKLITSIIFYFSILELSGYNDWF